MSARSPATAGSSGLIGYARVSTDDRGTDPQVDELRAAGCSTVHEEHASGADRSRPVLARVLREVRPGETLVVVRLDRLARSVSHLLAVIACCLETPKVPRRRTVPRMHLRRSRLPARLPPLYRPLPFSFEKHVERVHQQRLCRDASIGRQPPKTPVIVWEQIKRRGDRCSLQIDRLPALGRQGGRRRHGWCRRLRRPWRLMEGCWRASGSRLRHHSI
jgi:hypothetical protein